MVFWLSIAGDGVEFVVLLRVIVLLGTFLFLDFLSFFLWLLFEFDI